MTYTLHFEQADCYSHGINMAYIPLINESLTTANSISYKVKEMRISNPYTCPYSCNQGCTIVNTYVTSYIHVHVIVPGAVFTERVGAASVRPEALAWSFMSALSMMLTASERLMTSKAFRRSAIEPSQAYRGINRA